MPSAGVEEPPRDICVRSASVGDKSGLDMMPVATCRGVLIPSALCGLAVLYIVMALPTALMESSYPRFSYAYGHSFFTVLFTLSAIALCSGSPHCVMLIRILFAFNRSVYLNEAYWMPLSEWWMSSLVPMRWLR